MSETAGLSKVEEVTSFGATVAEITQAITDPYSIPDEEFERIGNAAGEFVRQTRRSIDSNISADLANFIHEQEIPGSDDVTKILHALGIRYDKHIRFKLVRRTIFEIKLSDSLPALNARLKTFGLNPIR